MIIVTGASGGLGKKVVDQLKEIDSILAIYNSSPPLMQSEDNVRYIKADLSNLDGAENVVNELKGHRYDNITFLNMLAIKKDQLLVNHDLDSWHETLNINLTSSFYFAKLILPLMMKAQWGRFIFLSSTGGVEGDIGTVSYSTSKTALIGFSKVISKEYSRFNITSNILSLGTFDTGLFHNLDKKKQDEILQNIPSRKAGNISNITNAIDFIIKSDYVNGSIINIDGGV
jgi:3-oxoacyl-[acyl-carrier protein] reductase